MDNQNNYPMFPIPVPIPVPMPGPYYPPYGGGYGPGYGHGGGYGPGYGHGGGYGPGYGHGGGHMGGGHMGGGRPRISLAEEDKQALRDEIESLKIKLDDHFSSEGIEAFYHGMDFGFANDPSTVIRCFIRDEDLYIDKEAYGHLVLYIKRDIRFLKKI